MRTRWVFKQKGVTLIELLVALVICAIVIGAIYRLFIVQTRAYTVQDQVVEVQQSVRSTMEILLRDLRMTGFDDDSTASTVKITNPIVTAHDNDIQVSYEYYNTTTAKYELHSVRYYVDGNLRLLRTWSVTPAGGMQVDTTDPLLENVDDLAFTYGIDTDEDGDVDNWVVAASVGTSKIIAVSVTLTARPDQTNPDVKMRVSPRTLTSAVSFRNLIMK